MKNIEVLNGYNIDPTYQVSKSNPVAKKRTRRSKLKSETQLIFRLWGEGKSLQFICDRLRAKSICCHRSSVSRFIRKAASL